MTAPDNLPEKLEFLRYEKAPILLMCLVWSIALVAFLMSIAALDYARSTKPYDAVYLLGASTTIVAAGFVSLWYQIRRLNKKLKVVADLLSELNQTSKKD